MSSSENDTLPGQQFCFTGQGVELDMVTICVGPEKKEFLVHRAILASSSSFFVSAIKKQWQDGGRANIEVPEDRADVIGLYLEWLYSGKRILSFRKGLYLGVEAIQERLMNAHIFGDKICDVRFANHVMDGLINTIVEDNEGASAETINWVYDETSERSPLRKLMVHIYAAWSDKGWYDTEFNQEFLRDVVCELLSGREERRKTGQWFTKHKKDYHLEAAVCPQNDE